MAFLSGYHSVHEALRSRPRQVRRVLVGSRASSRRVMIITELAERHEIEVSSSSNSELTELASEEHQGFVIDIDESGPSVEPSTDPELIVLVEDVQDPRNLGALLRVCEGAGVGRVVIRDRGSAPLTETVSKTSAGATEWLSIERIANSTQTLEG